jgi:VWFA-related protein
VRTTAPYTESMQRIIRPMRAAVHAALIALLASASTTAQQQSTQPPRTPVFTSGVDVVSVDATVINHDGQPVRDLTPQDFAVTVDGVPRAIVSAQFVSLSAPKSSPVPSAPNDYSSNVSAGPPGRLIAVVVDRGSIAPVRAKDVFSAAATFVEGLRPEDRVGLFSIPEGPNFDFTTDHDLIAEALRHTDGAAARPPDIKNVGLAEALEMERGNSLAAQTADQRECGATIQDVRDSIGNSDVAMCVRLVQDEAATIATDAHARARNTINSLASLLGRLGNSETPKTVVLLSEGLVIDGERFLTERLGPLLASAHATVFAIAPEPSEGDASQARVPQSHTQDLTVKETGLMAVSRMSGGEMFRVLSNPDFSFARLASELSGYYLIGFQPEAHDRDGKQHKIALAVRRPGVQIRARAEFSVEPVTTTNIDHIVADLLRSAASATSLPFKLTTYAFQDSDPAKIRLLVGMETDQKGTGNLAMGLVLVKSDGQPAAAFLQPSVDTHANGSGPHTYFATMTVEPGRYVLKAALVDADGHRGSVERPVRAYLTRMGRFRATQLLIGDGKDATAAAGSIAPTVTGDLGGETLYAYMELLADTPAAYDPASVRIDVVAEGSSNAVDTAPAVLQQAGPDPRDRAAAGSLSLARLTPGSYVARAVVLVDGQPVGEMTRPFRIVRPSAR